MTTPTPHPIMLTAGRDALRALADTADPSDLEAAIAATTDEELDRVAAAVLTATATVARTATPTSGPVERDTVDAADAARDPDAAGVATCPRCGRYRGTETIRDVADDDPRPACAVCVPPDPKGRRP